MSKPIPKIKIEKGKLLPKGNRAFEGKASVLRVAIAKLRRGESFMWPDNFSPHSAARDIGATISTRKINGSGYRVWKVRSK